MTKFNSKLLTTAALAAALVAGCGGGGGDGGSPVGGGQGASGTNQSTSAQGVVDFLLALFATETSDVNEPIPTDNITFATEELAEPSPI